MTGRHDTDTRIHAFLQEGPAELSPHTLADIRAGVASMPRRRPRHLGRIRHMPRSLLILAPVAAALLVGLVANAAVGAWWLDPVVGLLIAAVAVREGREAWRGEGCGCGVAAVPVAPGASGCADECGSPAPAPADRRRRP